MVDKVNGFSLTLDTNNATLLLTRIKGMIPTNNGSTNAEEVPQQNDNATETSVGEEVVLELLKLAKEFQARKSIEPQRVYETLKDPTDPDCSRKILRYFLNVASTVCKRPTPPISKSWSAWIFNFERISILTLLGTKPKVDLGRSLWNAEKVLC